LTNFTVGRAGSVNERSTPVADAPGSPRRRAMTRKMVCVTMALAFAPYFLGSPGRAEDSERLKLVQTIPLDGAAGRLDHMALHSKGERLFVANLSNNSLDVVDLKAGMLIKQIPDQKKIQGVAYAPDLDRIFVGNGEADV